MVYLRLHFNLGLCNPV